MPIVTIPLSERKAGPYTAVADQTVFGFAFPVLDADHLTVWRERAGVIAVLTETTDYTVSGVGEQSGGTITLTSSALAGDIIAIDGTLPQERATSFVGGTPFKTAFIDSDLNRIAIMAQELHRKVGRSIRRASVDALNGDLTLPWDITEDTLLALNASGDLIGLIANDFAGPQGVVGPSGQTILSGAVAPDGGVGTDGDFYIDTVAATIYGPKTAGVRGSPTSLVGPPGAGSGDVVGPEGATDGHVVVFSGSTGKLIGSAGFAPANAVHNHAISGVTGLQAALDAREVLGELADINTQTGTAYTLVLADKGKTVEMNNAAANDLTIPGWNNFLQGFGDGQLSAGGSAVNKDQFHWCPTIT